VQVSERLHLGVVHHYGWAVAVVATDQHEVVERRRVELIGEGLPAAPVHHEGGPHPMHRSGQELDDAALADLVAAVRASVRDATEASLERLVVDMADPIDTISVRAWPPDFPTDVARQRQIPYESRADSVMYCQILAALGAQRGWEVHTFDARRAEGDATVLLGGRARQVLHGPRDVLGAPWSKDHRIALAATVLAARSGDVRP
jgi:hypothetical protein